MWMGREHHCELGNLCLPSGRFPALPQGSGMVRLGTAGSTDPGSLELDPFSSHLLTDVLPS